MFQSLRSRLWLTYMLIGGSILGVVGILLLLLSIRNPLPVRRTALQLESFLLSTQQVERLPNLPDDQVFEFLKRADQRQGIRLLVVNPKGEVRLDSREGTNPPLTKIQLPRRTSSKDTHSGTFRDANRQEWIYAVRVINPDFLLAAAILRPPIPFREILNDDILRPFVQGWFVALLLALVLSAFISRWIAAPLQRILQEAQQIEKPEFHPVPLTGPTETQELAQAFNDMVTRVRASRQSQRDFVANVSHELKTPLTSIQGFAQAILDGTVEDLADIQHAAEIIHTETERMNRLVVDLLDLARIESGTASFSFGPVDLEVLLKHTVNKFSPQANQKQVILKLDLEALPTLHGDGDRLVQVFNNLIDNAIAHTPPGGEVILAASPLINAHVVITVSDTGPGIPPAEQQRIFERFYQLDKARTGGQPRGAGLGLAIAAEIIQAHQGKISVESSPRQGSRFVVKIPVQNTPL